MEGVVKTIKLDKGFGFITIAGREKDVFFHARKLVPGLVLENLKVGDKVSIQDIENTEKGEAAIGVDLVY